MKAVRIHVHGGGNRLRYEDADDPQLRSPSDAVVKLRAAAVNALDLRICADSHGNRTALPRIPGADGAGTLVAVGTEASHLRPGDAVCIYPVIGCGRCHFCAAGNESMCGERHLLSERENGTYAEYALVPAKNCYPIPAGLSFEEAAAFPLVYTTAFRMLFAEAGVKPGETVLMIGAGGGIATASIQLAVSAGARAFVSSRNKEKLAAAEKLGARGIDCRIDELAKKVRRLTGKRGVDVVVNSVGGETWAAGLAALARGGRLVTCGSVAGANPESDLRRVFWNHLKILAVNSGTRQDFCRVANFFNGSCRKPVIDRVFPLSDANRAHQRLQQGGQFGKIILRMDEDAG